MVFLMASLRGDGVKWLMDAQAEVGPQFGYLCRNGVNDMFGIMWDKRNEVESQADGRMCSAASII